MIIHLNMNIIFIYIWSIVCLYVPDKLKF